MSHAPSRYTRQWPKDAKAREALARLDLKFCETVTIIYLQEKCGVPYEIQCIQAIAAGVLESATKGKQ